MRQNPQKKLKWNKILQIKEPLHKTEAATFLFLWNKNWGGNLSNQNWSNWNTGVSESLYEQIQTWDSSVSEHLLEKYDLLLLEICSCLALPILTF